MDDLLKMAAELFLKHMNGGGNLNLQQVIGALQQLLPTEQGQLNIGALVSQFSQDGLDNLVQSFLGDGQNMTMTASQVMGMLGGDNISNFASQLNMEPNNAAETLSNVLPELIDKNSQGGALGGLAAQVMGSFFK
mgnify:CR=1 FL=1